MSGTMIRRIRNNWLPIILTIAILVSLGLSWMIWTNPSRYDREHESSSTSGQSQLTSKTISDVFLPNQVVQTGKNGQQHLLYAKKSNLTDSIKKQVSHWQMGRVSKVTSGDEVKYLGTLNQKNALIMNYPDSITTSIFNETFKQSINQKKVKKIDRIVIPLNDPRSIYLLKDDGLTVYKARVSEHPGLGKIKKMVSQESERVKVAEQLLNKRIIIALPEQTTFPVYSYLMTKQSDSSFTNALLNSDSSYNVAVHKKGHVTTYTDGTDKRMKIDSKNGKASYEDFLDEDNRVADSQLLTKSFQQLSEIGVSLENIRYDSIDLGTNQVIYRTYVECFPIYNKDDYGTVMLRYARNGKQTYNFSLYSLEVPIPNDATQDIPSTKDVLSRLDRAGKISDLRIEYEWGNSRKSNTVVNLKPAYYVKYQGKWSNYEELLNQ